MHNEEPCGRHPVGLMPRYLWVDRRITDILEALDRYRRGRYVIPVEWVEELADLLRENATRD